MSVKSIGLITYQAPHLKTEQILLPLMQRGYRPTIYALPFLQRKPREPLFHHRPDHNDSVHTKVLAQKHGLKYMACEATDIDNDCDVYLIMGASILSDEVVSGKFILNSHSGIIPHCRGLDAFKWAILYKRTLGVTLHRIDKTVDFGKIYSVVPTPVYKGDTIETLARRHYENENNTLLEFERHLETPVNTYDHLEIHEPTRRMKREIEQEMLDSFDAYVDIFKNTK